MRPLRDVQWAKYWRWDTLEIYGRRGREREHMQRKMLSCDVVSVEAPADPMGSADTRLSFRVVPSGATWKANMSLHVGHPGKDVNMGRVAVYPWGHPWKNSPQSVVCWQLYQQLAKKSFIEGAARQSILIPSFSNDKCYLVGAQKLVAFLLILQKVLLTGTVKLKVLVTFVYFSLILFFFFFSSKHKWNIWNK